jgi:DNA-binding response OmpR family regulator
LAAGADDFIEKPIDIDELLARTASWVARGRSRSQVVAPELHGDRLLQAASELASGRQAVELASAMAAAIGELP